MNQQKRCLFVFSVVAVGLWRTAAYKHWTCKPRGQLSSSKRSFFLYCGRFRLIGITWPLSPCFIFLQLNPQISLSILWAGSGRRGLAPGWWSLITPWQSAVWCRSTTPTEDVPPSPARQRCGSRLTVLRCENSDSRVVSCFVFYGLFVTGRLEIVLFFFGPDIVHTACWPLFQTCIKCVGQSLA